MAWEQVEVPIPVGYTDDTKRLRHYETRLGPVRLRLVLDPNVHWSRDTDDSKWECFIETLDCCGEELQDSELAYASSCPYCGLDWSVYLVRASFQVSVRDTAEQVQSVLESYAVAGGTDPLTAVLTATDLRAEAVKLLHARLQPLGDQ